jgi:hypothetical protein
MSAHGVKRSWSDRTGMAESDPERPKPAATPLYPKLEKAKHGRANLDELIRGSNLISMALARTR